MQAQKKSTHSKVPTMVMPMATILIQSNININDFQTAARFFKVKNARVKQALLFKPRIRKTFFA